MRQELAEKLFEVEPKWFNRTDITSSLMCFGFECGDGWFDLLLTLLEQIKSEDPGPDFEVMQVKEKLGGLRFYSQGSNDKIDAMVDFAEALSYKICEKCGAPGKPNDEGWIATLCRGCRGEGE